MWTVGSPVVYPSKKSTVQPLISAVGVLCLQDDFWHLCQFSICCFIVLLYKLCPQKVKKMMNSAIVNLSGRFDCCCCSRG